MGWPRDSSQTWWSALAAGKTSDRPPIAGPTVGLGILAAIGMLIVLVMGATVTSTGSAQGCGHDWPLCNGRLIPEFAVSTFIEFSHRVVTAAESLLIILLAVALLVFWRDRRPIRALVPAMLASLVAQALMGAWAVKYPQASAVLALHFGLSLIALAATTLTAAYAWQSYAGRVPTELAPPRLRWLALGNAGYLYLLVYSGAYIRHTGAASACTAWPLCGHTVGSLAFVVDLAHRAGAGLALLAALALLAMCLRSRRRDLTLSATALVGGLLAQGAGGAYLVASGFALGAELLHAALTGVVFTAACLVCLQVLLAGERSQQPIRSSTTLAA